MFKAKKSLGQNFLKSQKVLNKIIETGNLSGKDVVLEIGPGKGALTGRLLESGAKVIAVEKDTRATKFLKEKFTEEISNNKLELLQEDILEFDPNKLPAGYKLIANIPYYITGEIIEKFLSTKNKPSLIILLVQKEVALRIIARDEKESILSNSVKIFGEPKYIITAKKKDFSPSPKIDSAVILIENISNKNFKDNNIKEEEFFKVLKEGFKHKRKRVIKNLANIINEDNLLNLGINKDARAENLKLEDWIKITKN